MNLIILPDYKYNTQSSSSQSASDLLLFYKLLLLLYVVGVNIYLSMLLYKEEISQFDVNTGEVFGIMIY